MRDVDVKVYDKQVYPTHFDEANNSYKGNVALKNDKIYITYKDESSGVTTIIKTANKGVVVKRIGALGGELHFEKGKIYTTQYATPYGMLPLEIKTNKCDIYVLEKGIKIYIEYMIFMENNKVSDNTFMIITN